MAFKGGRDPFPPPPVLTYGLKESKAAMTIQAKRERCAIIIQAAWRGFVCRSSYLKKRDKLIMIQIWTRMLIAGVCNDADDVHTCGISKSFFGDINDLVAHKIKCKNINSTSDEAPVISQRANLPNRPC